MSRHVVSCRAEDELPHVEGLMARNRKSRIVVLDGAGRPVGVVSLSDIARHDQLFAAETMRQVSSREVLSA